MSFGHEERPWKFADGGTRNINLAGEFSFEGNEDDSQHNEESPWKFADGETRNINLTRAFSFDGNEDDSQHNQESPWKFADEERRNINLTREFSFNGNEDDSQLDEERPWKFADGETRNINLTREFSFDGNEDDSDQLISARTSCASAASFPVCPMSPGTPWIRSPVHAASPTPPLLYDCLASLHRSEGNIFSLTITKDLLFTASSSKRIHAWKQPDCTEMGYIRATTGEIRAILASEKLLFTAHGDCRIRAWELMSPTGNFRPKKMMTLPRRRSIFSYPLKKNNHQHRDPISCLAYDTKDNLLFTGSFDHTVKVWKVSEKRCIDSFVAHEGHVNAIVINPEDGYVFTCSSDGTVKIWRRVSRESTHILMMILKFQPSSVNAMALSLSSPGVSYLYSGSSDGLINFWEKERISGRYKHGGFLQAHHFAVLCLVTIEDLVLSGSEDATLRIWRREKHNALHSSLAVIDGHHGPVKCLAAAMETGEIDNGLLVYSASLDQTLKVWRVKVYSGQCELGEI